VLATAVAAVAVFAAGCEVQPAEPDPGAGGETSAGPGNDPETGTGPGAGDAAGPPLPGLPGAAEARELLAGLTVAAPRPMTGYSRDHFPHWSSEDGCTVRQTVLRRDGRDVRVDEDCQPVSGTWLSAYDGVEFTEAGDLDIDHMVPLANAWRSGADTWTDEERETFANDLTHPQLIAVGARVNREKGDQSPDEWQPPAEDFHCVYARAWTAVKDVYALTITADERDRLGTMLDTCG
jgi:hypothetical protein